MILDSARDWPKERAGLKSSRKAPLYPGGLTGVSRVSPVNVPTFLKLEIQTHPEGPCRLHRSLFSDEVDRSMRSRGARNVAWCYQHAQKGDEQKNASADKIVSWLQAALSEYVSSHYENIDAATMGSGYMIISGNWRPPDAARLRSEAVLRCFPFYSPGRLERPGVFPVKLAGSVKMTSRRMQSDSWGHHETP